VLDGAIFIHGPVEAVISVNHVKTWETYHCMRVQVALKPLAVPCQAGSVTSSVMSGITNHF
jgi:hypothetical protein